MKKMILLASALALGGVAYAQDTAPAPTAQPGMTAPDSSATPPADAGMAPPAQPGAADPAAAPAQPGMADPNAAAPAQPSMADPNAAAPAQPGMATGPRGPVSMTPTQGATDLPTCSKSVTDNCKQGGSGRKARKRR